MKQTEIFQILSDQLRLRALVLIAKEGELCVCELVHALDTPQPKISRNMGTMREAGIVVARRHAQWVFYSLNPSLVEWQQQIIDVAAKGIAKDALVQKDKRRLAQMKDRPERCNIA